ncbi:FAD/NAD(P)-binding protein [Cellulophaga sp. HaHaR_3_176]|uniref:FAD/NAD(P)-binding protein n=1 Tax=Cellulophaga sp. HaHaR_3_176 TaxID=1942464 RepID=UPI001C1F3C00|nr:FAD/NAD(P)-binding protein [Cellulophaga sp. HaHaR_3_176]QWX85023.1 FAD/NAD(P)-binding protein [Cellulophaga sp. HaHaR_3_176]
MNKLPELAIVGCGPRGLSALESLYSEAANKKVLPETLVFESNKYPGAGQVYNLDQPDSNWLNVSERGIGIPPRNKIVFKNFSIPEFPDFQNWSGYSNKENKDTSVDKFPFRSKLGEYLNQRYHSIADVLIENKIMTFIAGEVDCLTIENDCIGIDVVGGKNYHVKQAVLCIGHQPIALDEQLTTWKNRVLQLDFINLFTQPYPTNRILESFEAQNEISIGIRGFGLAMIDVARALSEGLGGKFKIINKETREMEYIPSGKEPNSLVPFSLDGMPMVPKPVNKKIDTLYVPTENQLNTYETSITESLQSKIKPDSVHFLIDAIAPIAAHKFMALGSKAVQSNLKKDELIAIITSWLLDDEFSNPLIISKQQPAKTILEQFIKMATGKGLVSLDFCIGHVWRHCQPSIYRLLSFSELSDDLISDIVLLDERLKRYTFGPPVESLQQIIALINANKIDLDFVNNPEIELTDTGWEFTSDNKTKKVVTMVNSVLDSPQILKVMSPLAKGLINSEVVEPIHDKLGIRTKRNAIVESNKLDATFPLALMGRLAKGTLIGVDAIAECFGERSNFWAEGVIKRV